MMLAKVGYAACAAAACSFAVAAGAPDWENHAKLSEGSLPPRAWFGVFPDVESAKAIRPELSSRRISLDSERDWRFRWSRRPSERPQEFFKPGYDVSGWDVVKVPCSWQAMGIRKSGERFGTPIYVNQHYIFTPVFPAFENQVSGKRNYCFPRFKGCREFREKTILRRVGQIKRAVVENEQSSA